MWKKVWNKTSLEREQIKDWSGISIVLYTLKHIHTNIFYLLSALGLDFDFDFDFNFDVWEAVSSGSKVDDGLSSVDDDGLSKVVDGLSKVELGELMIEEQFTFN